MKAMRSSISSFKKLGKKRFVQLLSVVVAICVAALFLIRASYILKNKSDYPKLHDFYKAPEEYDVWFMGSSQSVMATLPEELWKEYGIRSYNLSDYGQTIPLDYWIVKNLINLAKPELIVLDVGMADSDELYSESNLGGVKRMIRSLPWSRDKLDAINDLFEGDIKEAMLLPLAESHNNWKSISKSNFVPAVSYELGADVNTFRSNGANAAKISPMTMPAALPIDEFDSKKTIAKQYIVRTIELCQAEGIAVLLVKCPIYNAKMKAYNDAFKIGLSYGVPYFNGYEILGIDGQTDLWDAGHLNSSGALKWTSALGQYISENYSFDEGNAKLKAKWDERYAQYCDFWDDMLAQQSNVYQWLLMAYHPGYTVAVRFNAKTDFYLDDKMLSLLKNIGDFPGLSEAIESRDAYVGISGKPVELDSDVWTSFPQSSISLIVLNEKLEIVDCASFNADSKQRITE